MVMVLSRVLKFLNPDSGSIRKPVGRQKLSINISQSKKEKYTDGECCRLKLLVDMW